MAKVNINIKGLEGISKRVVTKVNRAIKNTEILEEIADLIVVSVREGDPVRRAKEANKKYKSELSEAWIERRIRLSTVNSTHPDYSPESNNITFTGQLLDSIKSKLIVSKSKIIVEPQGNHKPYNYIKGGKSPQISNKELAKFVQELREFLFLTPGELEQITDILKKRLRRALKEEFQR